MAPFVDYSSGDHYKVLGVSRDASDAEITRVYKTLARQYHPDKNPENQAEAELSFKRIADAYAALRDPKRRREYDLGSGRASYVSYQEAEQMWRSFVGPSGAGTPRAAGARSRGQRQAAPLNSEARQKGIGFLAVIASLYFAPHVIASLLPIVCLAVMAMVAMSQSPFTRYARVGLAIYLVWYLKPLLLHGGAAREPAYPNTQDLLNYQLPEPPGDDGAPLPADDTPQLRGDAARYRDG